jgi:hypothetical protein
MMMTTTRVTGTDDRAGRVPRSMVTLAEEAVAAPRRDPSVGKEEASPNAVSRSSEVSKLPRVYMQMLST